MINSKKYSLACPSGINSRLAGKGDPRAQEALKELLDPIIDRTKGPVNTHSYIKGKLCEETSKASQRQENHGQHDHDH